jgi:diguanylate cyclase (GGDEF)-like protein
MDWSKLPDFGAVALLTLAFGSVARRGQTPVSTVWLIGWAMIALHFFVLMFPPAPGILGSVTSVIGIAALTWAGVLFMWAAVPYHNVPSSRWMLAVLLGTNTLYIGVITMAPHALWALVPAALLLGGLPLALTLFTLRQVNHLLRWTTVLLYVDLSIFLLAFQHRSGNGADLALNGVLFAVYFGCCIHFWYCYRRATAGAFITIAGFLAWAAVFAIAPGLSAFAPALRIEGEVWNLPEYLVAVGMILLLLEDQIDQNKYLALHDELTGLPNRRLFEDRLARTLDRARRTGSQAALLLIDLDHFKQVNDTAGHHIGDLLLRRVSELFSGQVRRSDTVARTGGDEFSVILETVTSREDADRVACSLAELLKEPFELGAHMVSVGASVGIAIFPGDGATAESLCIAADRNMYSTKFASRGSRLDTSTLLPLSS